MRVRARRSWRERRHLDPVDIESGDLISLDLEYVFVELDKCD